MRPAGRFKAYFRRQKTPRIERDDVVQREDTSRYSGYTLQLSSPYQSKHKTNRYYAVNISLCTAQQKVCPSHRTVPRKRMISLSDHSIISRFSQSSYWPFNHRVLFTNGLDVESNSGKRQIRDSRFGTDLFTALLSSISYDYQSRAFPPTLLSNDITALPTFSFAQSMPTVCSTSF